VRRQAERTKAVELDVMRACDMVWVTSTHELDLLRRENQHIVAELVPAICDVRSAVPTFDERRDVLFIGGFRHPPNEDAVVSFTEQIWPLVKQELPDARFVIVGSHITPRVANLARADILVLGHVADVAPVFDSCRLSVAPIRYGAGVNGKVVQSMAWGLPVVATPQGVEGLGLKHREQVLVASQADEFAQSLVALYSNQQLWERLVDAGRRYVDTHLSSASLKQRLESLLGRIGRFGC
jgi:glycosyltransferase involved in cell wall biosynthesis